MCACVWRCVAAAEAWNRGLVWFPSLINGPCATEHIALLPQVKCFHGHAELWGYASSSSHRGMKTTVHLVLLVCNVKGGVLNLNLNFTTNCRTVDPDWMFRITSGFGPTAVTVWTASGMFPRKKSDSALLVTVLTYYNFHFWWICVLYWGQIDLKLTESCEK